MTFPLFLALALIVGPAFAEKPKPSKKSTAPKKVERTWAAVVEHVMTHGAKDTVKGPSSRVLGYESDAPAKGLYLDQADSADGIEHSISIVVDDEQRPKEIVIDTIRVVEKDKIQDIVGHSLRLKLNGEPIRGMGAEGIVGHVKQRPLTADSAEAKKFLADETKFWLKLVDFSKLKNDL